MFIKNKIYVYDFFKTYFIISVLVISYFNTESKLCIKNIGYKKIIKLTIN